MKCNPRTRTIVLACIVAGGCETGNVRDARRSDIITDAGTRIGWEETDGVPFDLNAICPVRSWSVRVCAAGTWERRWPAVSAEASSPTPQSLSVEITPGSSAGRYASVVDFKTGPAGLTRQVFGEGLKADSNACEDYTVSFTRSPAPDSAEVSVEWFVVAFVEGRDGGEVALLDIQEASECP